MCGICGWHSFRDSILDPKTIHRMILALHHRGPDEVGHWHGDRTSLGHARLSILDLKTGSQPLIDSDGRVIVFNGEIYNYLELRNELIKDGISFRTNSDTEVVLEAYKKWGERCVTYFNGMFAIAITDPVNQKLFLARDYLGKKPLYYFLNDDHFVFASELKAILQHEFVRNSVELDTRSIIDYLSLGYILSPKTIFSNLYRIAPASYAYLDYRNDTFSQEQYWSLRKHFRAPKIMSHPNRIKEEFDALLTDSVKLRLRADVPIGAFISSGLDSTSIVALAKQLDLPSFKTFCIGFSDKSFDEAEDVRKIAKQLNVDLEVGNYKPPSQSKLSQLIWHFDEPFADNSAMPTYQLNSLANNFGKVVLSGDGADELFAGYATYRANEYFRCYRKAPEIVQSGLQYFATKLLRPSYRKVSLDYRVRQFLASAGLSRKQAHYWWRVIFPMSEVQSILNPDILEEVRDYHPYHTFENLFKDVEGGNFLDQTLYVDTNTWLSDDILVKVDRMSMANSVEVRSPFLDHRLVEFAAALPSNQKMTQRQNKVLIRDCFRETLPSDVIRGKKRGFNAPPIRKARNCLPCSGLFRNNFQLHPGKEDVTFKSYNLLVLRIWFDMFDRYKKTGDWSSIDYGA